MRTFLALALLVAVSFAADPPFSSYGGYSGGYSGADYNVLNQQELINLDDYIRGLAFEQTVVDKKIDNLNAAEKLILSGLDKQIEKLEDLAEDNAKKTGELRVLSMRIRDAFSSLGAIQARAVGEEAGAQRLNQLVLDFQERIDSIRRGTNNQQNADIAAANELLGEAVDTCDHRIDNDAIITAQDVEKIKKNTDQLVAFTNSRKCFSVYVHVDIDPETNEGKVTADIPDGFWTTEDRPTVFCGIQGFISDVNLKKSHQAPSYGQQPSTYGYSYYEDEVQHLAVATLCSATSGTITAYAVDQSRGQGNVVSAVYLQVKVCSLCDQAPGAGY